MVCVSIYCDLRNLFLTFIAFNSSFIYVKFYSLVVMAFLIYARSFSCISNWSYKSFMLYVLTSSRSNDIVRSLTYKSLFSFQFADSTLSIVKSSLLSLLWSLIYELIDYVLVDANFFSGVKMRRCL